MDDEVDTKRGCLDRLAVGCAGFIALVVVLLAGGCIWLRWEEPRGQLPDRIEVAEIVASRSSGVIIEGCFFGLYRMTPRTVAALRRRGLEYLGDDTYSEKVSYGPWRATPLTVVGKGDIDLDGDGRTDPLYALGATATACSSNVNEGPLKLPPDLTGLDVERALKTPGNFVAITPNREGLMLAIPATGVAVVLYFG